ncbi:MAG: hypothetical protein ACOY3P_25580 [Planctomycetota bacterium]
MTSFIAEAIRLRDAILKAAEADVSDPLPALPSNDDRGELLPERIREIDLAHLETAFPDGNAFLQQLAQDVVDGARALLDHARHQVADGSCVDPGGPEVATLNEAITRLGRRTTTKPECDGPVPPRGPRFNTNARMLDALQLNPECRGWTSTKWSQHLKVTRSMVTQTRTWADLQMARNQLKAEKAADRRRRRHGA